MILYLVWAIFADALLGLIGTWWRTGMCSVSSLGTSEYHLNSATILSPHFMSLAIFLDQRSRRPTFQYIVSSAARSISGPRC
jgi:hypothetical protein